MEQGKIVTGIRQPLLESLLQAPHVERFAGHTDEGHYFEKLLLAGVAELLNVVAACQFIVVLIILSHFLIITRVIIVVESQILHFVEEIYDSFGVMHL